MVPNSFDSSAVLSVVLELRSFVVWHFVLAMIVEIVMACQ